MKTGYYIDSDGGLAILYPGNKWSWWICFAGEWHFSSPDFPLWNTDFSNYEFLRGL